MRKSYLNAADGHPKGMHPAEKDWLERRKASQKKYRQSPKGKASQKRRNEKYLAKIRQLIAESKVSYERKEE